MKIGVVNSRDRREKKKINGKIRRKTIIKQPDERSKQKIDKEIPQSEGAQRTSSNSYKLIEYPEIEPAGLSSASSSPILLLLSLSNLSSRGPSWTTSPKALIKTQS